MAPPLPVWQSRKTLIDLYNEKEQTRSILSLIATISAMLLMTSFLILPTAFISRNADSVNSNSNLALIASIILLILSYLISLTLAFRTKSSFFHLDVIFKPHLISSILGLVNIGYSIGTQAAIHLNGRVIAGITLPIVSALAYGVAAMRAFEKIRIVRAREAMQRRNPPPLSNAPIVPEMDMQRQNLLQLLRRHDDGNTSSCSCLSRAQSTYKIQWPNNRMAFESRRSTVTTTRNLQCASRNRLSNGRNFMPHLASSWGIVPHHQPPSDHLTGGIEHVPELIAKEVVVTAAEPHWSGGPPLLPQAVYNPNAPSHVSESYTGDRVPSYHQQERPGQYINPSSSPNEPSLDANGYPVEKPEGSISHSIPLARRKVEKPLDGYAVIDAPVEMSTRRASKPGAVEGRAEIGLVDTL
ncbi:MAG: hypothetical protein Q9163_000175 [Psora crenata]